MTLALRIAVGAVLLVAASAAAAQSTAEDRRGSIPPGSAADGSGPAEGAITGGVPDHLPIEERVGRCKDLTGALRQQCLRDAQNAGAGSTRAPGTGIPKSTRTPGAPPPQNPR
jgi:hypothetical protein